MSKRHLVTLDAMRGIAAIFVAVFHMPRLFGYKPFEGGRAVDFFLVLSGFIVCYAYQDKLTSGRLTFLGFCQRRLIRFYPTFLIGISFGLPVAFAAVVVGSMGATIDWNINALVASLPNLLMLPSPWIDSTRGILYPLNPPLWTVAYEYVLSVIFALIVVKFNFSRRLIVALVGVVLTPLLSFLLHNDSSILIGYNWSHVLIGFCRLSLGFLIGILVYKTRKLKFYTSSLGSVSLLFVLFCVLAFLPSGNLYSIVCILAIFPVLVWRAAVVNPSGYAFNAAFSFLGLISFPLYAIHKPFYQIIYGFLVKFSPAFVETYSFAIGTVVLLLCIVISYLIASKVDKVVMHKG